MTAPVTAHWTGKACWERRQSLCIGYRTEYDEETRVHTVGIFAVQNGRTPAPLGTLKMAEDEWREFFQQVYMKWEDLEYPLPGDVEEIDDHP